jgi:hypothetical protein
MPLKQIFISLRKKIRKLPLELTISLSVLVFVSFFYGITFLLEKPVSFSYAGPTCKDQLTLFPGLYKLSDKSDYIVHSANEVKFGGLTVASFKVCFTPQEVPKVGVTKVSVSPFGGWFARTTYALTVAPPVIAHVEKLTKPIPISRPLELTLSGTDTTFSYVLKLGDKQTKCKPLDAKLSCKVDTLNLVQGQTYPAELMRMFKDKKVDVVAKKDIAILSATRITDSSIKADETVYTKPKTIDLVFDKKLVKATVTLYQIEAEKRTKIATTSALSDKGVQLTTTNELPRSANYELVADGVEADDGSSLEETYKLTFKTSGGPKVTGINVGKVGVALGTTAVVSFDQPLSEKQDISKIVVFGGGASLVGKRNNQLLVSLAGVPKCGDFSIKIGDDLQSNYDIAGGSAWGFTGRMICHTVSTIGYSSKGRAINAYYFGNGTRTLLYTGAIHGNEVSTKALMEKWIQDLEANAHNIPADKQIVVVPQINPDGVAAGSRVNGRNVDLNRNFSTSDWRADITDVNNNPFPGGGGLSPMSEPETVAIASLASKLHPVLILSYHSIGGVVAANQAGGSSGLAATYSQVSGYQNVTGQTAETFDYAVSGTADDWYAERLGVASLLIELNSNTYHQFERNQKAMWAMVNL